MLKVVLVDDEQIILKGLQSFIAWDSYGCEVIGCASDGLTGLKLIREARPDILLTDIRMPNMVGLTMIAALKSEFPNLQVCILTAYRDFEYAQQAIRLGVARYLLKPSKMGELAEAIAHMAAKLESLPPKNSLPEGVREAKAEESDATAFVIKVAIQYMSDHFAHSLRLADVADQVYVSQWHLSKLLNHSYGKSFYDILSEIRIDEAKKLLSDPALKIYEVAGKVGFNDVAHFSKTFKRLTGKSPVDYRAKRED
ncbi:MAG: response regulator [Clostridiales bacterium]|nr:response regulator [Clostridiales bacterium]